jgi:large subunit ribosomal protein LP0
MSGAERYAKKRAYGAKLRELVNENRYIMLVDADNVGSKQLQNIRVALRGRATMLMGKNTTIRKVLSELVEEQPDHPISALIDYIQGNVGMIFTNNSVGEVKDLIAEHTKPAPAKAGAVAPVDYTVMPGPTGEGPGSTGFFQALGINTKIMRGQIDIVSPVQVIFAGQKVSESASTLLQLLNIAPFSYRLEVVSVYDDGEVWDAAVLDITDDDLVGYLQNGARFVASIGVELGVPTLASLPHSINNAFKRCLAIGIEGGYSFPQGDEFKDFLANPANFAAAPAAGAAAAEVEVEEEEESEEESEEEEEGGMGLFD